MSSTAKKAVQYLADKNISSGNIKEGWDTRFIDAKIKDAYLEKFKIYRLVFNDKILEAQLYQIYYYEQNNPVNFTMTKLIFLGISNKTSNKINEKIFPIFILQRYY